MDERLTTLVREIREAAALLDRSRVAALCRAMIEEARGRPEPLPAEAAAAVLGLLQRKRYHDLSEQLAGAVIRAGQAAPGIRRRYVQALIDQGKLDEAHAELDRLVPDTAGDPRENGEARGLRGRALKQAYVAPAEGGAGSPDALRRAIATYVEAYREDPGKRAWHGINTVALLARARRDGVEVAGVEETPEGLARTLLEAVEGRGAAMDAWEMATGLEACVALGDAARAARWANGYAAHPGADAFEIASTLRQITEVWRLDPSDGGVGEAVLPVLRGGLLRREEGSVELSPGEVRDAPRLERVLGRDSFVSLTWYRQGLDRARAVARISWPTGEAAGTGFLVRGRALAPALGDEWLLLTNHHVVNDDPADHDAVRPEKAVITFHALSDDPRPREYRGARLLWSSPTGELDAALLRLPEAPEGVDGLPEIGLAALPPDPAGHQRVYVIGHPRGDVLSFSIHDNLVLAHQDRRIHYRAPTEAGSSGSPVFNRDWELIGLHRAGGEKVERLDGVPGHYAANEGIWIQSIRGAVTPSRAGAPAVRRSAPPRDAPPPPNRERTNMDTLEARIRAAVAAVEERDPELRGEMEEARGRVETRDEARMAAESVGRAGRRPEAAESAMALETIVLRTGRPVLRVLRDEPLLEFRDGDSEVWRKRLTDARDRLVRGIRAVGRVEVEGHARFEWIGTAWLVAEDVVVTNRHVAQEFGRRGGAGFVFRQGVRGGPIQASVDFLEEFDRPQSLAFRVSDILHIEDENGPDLALLRVRPTGGQRLAAPIPLSRREARERQMVAVVGYPASDSRIPDQALMRRIFGDVFDKKRLAPGQVTGVRRDAVLHDASTLGGNSGSLVLDLDSGEAVAVHFAGRFLEANFAVPARLVAERLAAAVGRGRPPAPRPRPVEQPGVAIGTIGVPGEAVSVVTIPLQVTVTVGAPLVSGTGGGGFGGTGDGGNGDGGLGGDDDGDGGGDVGRDDDDGGFADEVIEEGRPEDYDGRPGYDPAFLGAERDVPLPAPRGKVKKDVLTFQLDGKNEYELRYQHFSVAMSRGRRMCLYSAVNIDGGKSKRIKRVGWRTDPRIPAEAQISKECYGPEPRFSRGHMTRREDPVWGDDAALGNADSMHVTNAVPQMQPFNAGIWLGLENYALENARQDDMRISVFTGPILRDDDPVRFGVKIPRSFWKVIAFIHDETGKLSATGYTMAQDDFLRETEFVFGQHETSQRPIAWIEEQTGLSFGPLAALDPLKDAEESVSSALTDLSQVRFV